jgi:hypothetical protein
MKIPRHLFLAGSLLTMLLRGQSVVSNDDQLVTRWNEFAKVANVFANDQHDGKFNMKTAKELSKLWRRVEQCGEWPK